MNSLNQFKTIALIFMLLCLANPTHGQTLHTIIFANTNDPQIGKSVVYDYNSLSVEVNTIAAATGMKLKRYFYKDEYCNNKNLRNVLNQLSTNKDDVILFYYSGHGTRSAQDISEFPQMCLGSHDDEDYYPLEKVLQKLMQQPARLKLILGDCCNSIGARVNPKDYTTRSVTVLSKEPTDAYNSLFANNQGFMIASSSKKGEVSYGDEQSGGAFTFCFLRALNVYAKQGMTTTWDKIMSTTREATLKSLEGKQTPVYVVQIKNETANTPSISHEPQNTATGEDSAEIEKIDILTAIGNEYFPTEKRVNLREAALKALFNNPNAKVEIVGSNGTTIVSTEKASDFVLRLCTAHKLIKLAEIDYTLDESGRYKSLKVHEIYKK